MMNTKRYDLKSSKLLLAVEQGKVEAAMVAIDSGEPVNTLDLDDNTPLIRASFLGNVKLMKALIERGANMDAVNDIGWTALHFAAQKNQQGAANLLLTSGCSVNARDPDGNTPLWRAAFSDAGPVVQLLVAAGASLDEENDHGVGARELLE
jgi:ankyrin repeat protein